MHLNTILTYCKLSCMLRLVVLLVGSLCLVLGRIINSQINAVFVILNQFHSG